MDEETAITVVNLKRQLKDAPLSVILKQARQREILPVDFKVSPATLYRLFNQHGLMDEEVLNEDLRRYEAEVYKDIWQSDCMHGPKKQLFLEEAILAIHQSLGGILKRANILARGSLIAAAREKCNVVSAEYVRIASTEVI